MEKKAIIEVQGQVELTFDDESKEFKEALESFKDVIASDGSKEVMLRHIAFYVTRFGVDQMVEGVGYVGFNGRKPTEEPFSGIMVDEDYDEFDFHMRRSD